MGLVFILEFYGLSFNHPSFYEYLPIPALDGGHVMFLLGEMITGRKPSDKLLEYAGVTGFLILIALLL